MNGSGKTHWSMLIWSAAATMVLSGLALAEPPENSTMSLLRNGTFETTQKGSEAPAQWKAADWSPAAARRPVQALVSLDGPDAAAGGSVHLTAEGQGGNIVLYQDLRDVAPGSYRLRVFCKPDAGSVAYASAVALQGGKTLVYENTAKIRNANEWAKLELLFAVPAEAEIVRILLRTSHSAGFADAAVVAAEGDGSVGDTRKEPSSGKALRSARPEVEYDREKDQARKAAMSPEELAWEELLEASLGSFYLPRYKVAKEKGRTTAWDYVKDDPALPRVLLIGDSISRGYTVPTRKALAGKANVHRAPENCGPTANGLKKLDIWLGTGEWDLIHFNFGIHDQRSAPQEYAERLERIVERLEKTGATLVFATSTPLPEDSDTYKHGACARLNDAAREVMARHDIAVNDLYGLMLPVLDTYQNPGDCHFNGEGYELMGQQVAATILDHLEENR